MQKLRCVFCLFSRWHLSRAFGGSGWQQQLAAEGPVREGKYIPYSRPTSKLTKPPEASDLVVTYVIPFALVGT
jgi:hypothetical protein